jgi:hypothetical protein
MAGTATIRRIEPFEPDPIYAAIARHRATDADLGSRCSGRHRGISAVCEVLHTRSVRSNAMGGMPVAGTPFGEQILWPRLLAGPIFFYQFPSRCRIIAGLSGFLTLIQSRDGPDR